MLSLLRIALRYVTEEFLWLSFKDSFESGLCLLADHPTA